MTLFSCFMCEYTDMGESLTDLVEDDWSDLEITVSTQVQPNNPPVTLHFCGPDCREAALRGLGLDDDPVSPEAERIMRGY